ncbi:uncharacterized protein LOC125491934 [Beta vulgaris subsp. vulgaris]|uniref:uncharacterized protein LOC125491934 n=1 Tax=Beta vulgaris subsp. vulgaris TaxID=3555 RepID=UPI002036DC2E|nr:uncharacterized protein LOC125491934 [Beta vulgaris subsp. vulgaris]
MKRRERSWMYDRREGRFLKTEFVIGVRGFIEFAQQNHKFKDADKIRCSCFRCNNKRFFDVDIVREHLYKKGFCHNYFDWLCHRETVDETPSEPSNPYRDMIVDALGHNEENPNNEQINNVQEEPNDEAKKFFELLKAADSPLYARSKVSVLEMASRIISLMCEYNLPHRCVDGFASLLNEVIPNNNQMSTTFYDTKKVLKGLQLPHEKIHACRNGCMLFWKGDAHLMKCSLLCECDRYKKTPKGKLIPEKVLTYFPIKSRLQRLYATKNISEKMTWHAKKPRVPGTIEHPSDSEAWKHFDTTFPDFAFETRNVRLGLCTDGFSPFGKFGGQYFCWPVILTPYNLPPSMCMKKPFMFLSLLVPGPKNPKGNLDVYMQPLIEELKQLWEIGAMTYDISHKQNFMLHAALLWTVSDFPAYSMLSGWATAGKKACPYCMEETKAFWLDNGNKVSWFDCHRKFLPHDHPFRKNKTAFRKNKVENGMVPAMMSGDDMWQCVKDLPKATDGPEALN